MQASGSSPRTRRLPGLAADGPNGLRGSLTAQAAFHARLGDVGFAPGCQSSAVQELAARWARSTRYEVSPRRQDARQRLSPAKGNCEGLNIPCDGDYAGGGEPTVRRLRAARRDTSERWRQVPERTIVIGRSIVRIAGAGRRAIDGIQSPWASRGHPAGRMRRLTIWRITLIREVTESGDSRPVTTLAAVRT